jgi:hypothetical protein
MGIVASGFAHCQNTYISWLVMNEVDFKTKKRGDILYF